MRRGRDGRERGVANAAVGGRNRLEMEVGGELPGDVVVGLAGILRVELRSQQVDREISIRLIEPHHIGSGGKGAFLERDLRGGAMHLDALGHEARYHLRDPRRIALIVWDQEREGCLLDPLAP